MNRTAVGVDIAKNVFQLHYIDQDTGEIVNKPIKRAKFLEHSANRAPCLIGMEACGGQTVDFLLTARRNLAAARRFLLVSDADRFYSLATR
ncbi:transposase [Paraburkholderia sp. JPY419]